MAASLRVNPGVLKSTAGELEQVGSAVTAVQPGQHLGDLPGAMAGLSSAAAFAHAATALDTATGRVGEDYTTFSSKVSRAMQTYLRADGDLAGDVQKSMEDPDNPQEDEGPGAEKDIKDWTEAWLKNTRDIEVHNAKPVPGPNDPGVHAYNDEANRLNYERTKLFMEAGEIFHDEGERLERTGGWMPPGWTPGTNGPTGGPPLVPGQPIDTSTPPGQPIPEGAPGHAPEW